MADKPYLSLETVQSWSFEDLPPIITYAVPVMLSLVLLEWYLGVRRDKKLYGVKEFWSSVGVGVGNLVSNAVVKLVMFAVVIWCYNITPFYIEPTWWSYILCIIFLDFWRYWAHRIAHEQRFLWATHVTHHSGEYYNFSVSFRLSWTQQIKLIFFLPVILVGFDPVVFFICHQMEVLYQFWIHTELIRKLHPWFEYVFTTPSHHRVHHGVNDKYIDKNYGSTFIIWDRMFGTFQPEEEQVVYGITRPVHSYNPVKLVFHEWVDIFKDIMYFKSFKKGLQVLFAPPGKHTRHEDYFNKVTAATEEQQNIEPTRAKINRAG